MSVEHVAPSTVWAVIATAVLVAFGVALFVMSLIDYFKEWK